MESALSSPLLIRPSRTLITGGFTLVELVAVMILIGILSAMATAKFAGRGTFLEYATRDQLRVALQYAQQGAMLDTAVDASGSRLRCYRLAIDGGLYGPQRDSGSGFAFIATEFGLQYPLVLDATLSISGQPVYIYFDSLGNSVADCSATSTQSHTIAVTGEITTRLQVESTGYAYGL